MMQTRRVCYRCGVASTCTCARLSPPLTVRWCRCRWCRCRWWPGRWPLGGGRLAECQLARESALPELATPTWQLGCAGDTWVLTLRLRTSQRKLHGDEPHARPATLQTTSIASGRDTLSEWSKGVDSSSTSASCVGSNPTGVFVIHGPRSNGSAICCRSCDMAREQLMHLASGLVLPSCVSGRVAAVAVVYACAGALLQRLAVWPSQARILCARFQEAQCERESLQSGGFGECVRFSAFALGGLLVTRWIARMDTRIFGR